jgi:hypothetical protein
MYFSGYQLIEASCMADKVQARTHKKKRINKKWRKRYGMKEIPWKKFCVFEGKIYAHPVMIQKLITEMAIKEVEI